MKGVNELKMRLKKVPGQLCMINYEITGLQQSTAAKIM